MTSMEYYGLTLTSFNIHMFCGCFVCDMRSYCGPDSPKKLPLQARTAARTFLFSSESVNEGHPDKLCDQVTSNLRTARETAFQLFVLRVEVGFISKQKECWSKEKHIKTI